MSVATIEQLQKIVTDETRSEEERRQAAEHILKLQGSEPNEAATLIGIFDHLLNRTWEEIQAEEDQRVAKENAKRKACPDCFRQQPIENDACDLCGHTPQNWLPGIERHPRRNKAGDIVNEKGEVLVKLSRSVGVQIDVYDAGQWRRWASTDASVAQLQHVVSKSGAPDAGWRIKHAAKILRLLKQDVPKTFYGETV